jgi:hypothetical protein
VRDLLTGQTSLVSGVSGTDRTGDADGGLTSATSEEPTFSADGTPIAFTSQGQRPRTP